MDSGVRWVGRRAGAWRQPEGVWEGRFGARAVRRNDAQTPAKQALRWTFGLTADNTADPRENLRPQRLPNQFRRPLPTGTCPLRPWL